MLGEKASCACTCVSANKFLQTQFSCNVWQALKLGKNYQQRLFLTLRLLEKGLTYVIVITTSSNEKLNHMSKNVGLHRAMTQHLVIKPCIVPA